jgi:hypothetical protein
MKGAPAPCRSPNEIPMILQYKTWDLLLESPCFMFKSQLLMAKNANITKVVGHSKSPCVMVKSPYLTIFHGQWIEHLRLAPREDLSE